MSPDRWIVTLAGLSLIAFIVWFFWLKRVTGFRATETIGGYQEAMILVKGGYTPDTIIVRHGRPIRLNFRREETASCSDKVIFVDFEKSAELPTGQTVHRRVVAQGARGVRVCMSDGDVPRASNRR